MADGGNELKLDDATKIIGCYKALTKNGLAEDVGADPDPMRRALAFCKDINSSKLVRDEFAAVIADYLTSEEAQDTEAGRQPLGCELQHVDGTFSAFLKRDVSSPLGLRSSETDTTSAWINRARSRAPAPIFSW